MWAHAVGGWWERDAEIERCGRACVRAIDGAVAVGGREANV